MAKTDRPERQHSGHYLSAVAFVTVVVAAMAWYGQNRTLALAAAALGLYALHLLSIRFLLENQTRQRQVLDAQWEVLQRLLGSSPGAEAALASDGELIPAMPIDREDPETLDTATTDESPAPDLLRIGDLVPPCESMAADSGEPEPVGEPGTTAGDQGPGAKPVPPDAANGRRGGAGENEVPVPRHFALGTVALVRNLLTPEEVARILLEQRRQPGRKFGILAVEMGLLSEVQREELLLAQQEGLFTDVEMREARQRLREFRESAAHSLVSHD